ncbi:hypothetical protein EMQ25_05605 [Arsenicitalea aurantiaca]|uniref:Uncharacterized protein n=1 Tax=Arsenicitalea aurantiaca TaxID=1783274 RepID=A0A433XF44_9HYPH|nr:hypothetical protein [Arsenicitalea aurantiaca]RUT32624.1 hypothetical protein EMQ25_05605 [Arsenicitalea aurantiaca]
MRRAQEIGPRISAATTAAYSVHAQLHLAVIGAAELSNSLRIGDAVTSEIVELAATLDRAIEAIRKVHATELDVLSDVECDYAQESGK